MSNHRKQAIEYIRGISMLGVVGIHTGAYSLSNPEVNVHLFALLEICTRFSVPIFFFVSAFGLFYNQDLTRPFDYGRFLLSRSRGVLIPYLIWSVLYMVHYTWASGDANIWSAPLIYEYFLFGLASYQLYFLVILAWFYLLMPLWRPLVRNISRHPFRNLCLLLVLQIVFNYYSCYTLALDSDNYYINIALQYRLSYWVLHYVFIFLSGAVCAVKFEAYEKFLKRRRDWLLYGFAVTLAGMLAHYYILLYQAGYTPEAAVNTVQQLSPLGVLYTAATTLFLYSVFSKAGPKTSSLLGLLGKYSFPIYLVHPFIMYYLSDYLVIHDHSLSVALPILFPLLDYGRKMLTIELKFGGEASAGGHRQHTLFFIIKECLMLMEYTARKRMTDSVADIADECLKYWQTCPETMHTLKSFRKFCGLILLYHAASRRQKPSALHQQTCNLALFTEREQERLKVFIGGIQYELLSGTSRKV